MLDLLSSLKERKTKSLKFCGQSKTTDRLDGRASGQLVRGLGSRTPLENLGGRGHWDPSPRLRGLRSDQKDKHKNKPKPLTRCLQRCSSNNQPIR